MDSQQAKQQTRECEMECPVLSKLPSKLRNQLLPFQREGVRFAVRKDGRCLIADEMGLGKTIQAISVAYYYKEEWPVLIIVPSSLKFCWIEELEKWLPDILPHQINLVQNGADVSGIATAHVTIITYGLLRLPSSKVIREAIGARKFKIIICDESHYLKNIKTLSTKTVIPLLKSASHRILLSGTPALAKPVELYPQIDAICPGKFGSYWQYTDRYCDAHTVYFGRFKKRQVDGASNLEELQQRLQSMLMIRREKSEVLTELPPKQRQRVLFELKHSDIKKEILERFADLKSRIHKGDKTLQKILHGEESRSEDVSGMFSRTEGEGSDMNMNVQEDTGPSVYSQISRLYKLSGEAKIGPVREYIEMLCDSSELKFLVFAYHHDMMDGVQQTLWDKQVKFVRIDGTTKGSDRQALVNQFQSDPETQVAILSILAAGVGLTFTAAKLVVFAELYWTPGVMVQCEDRAHRIGQTCSLPVHYLVARGTMDEWVWSAVCKKTIVTSTALTGKSRPLDHAEGDKYQIDLLSNAKAWKPQEDDETVNVAELLQSQRPSDQTSILEFFSSQKTPDPKPAVKRKLKTSENTSPTDRGKACSVQNTATLDVKETNRQKIPARENYKRLKLSEIILISDDEEEAFKPEIKKRKKKKSKLKQLSSNKVKVHSSEAVENGKVQKDENISGKVGDSQPSNHKTLLENGNKSDVTFARSSAGSDEFRGSSNKDLSYSMDHRSERKPVLTQSSDLHCEDLEVSKPGTGASVCVSKRVSNHRGEAGINHLSTIYKESNGSEKALTSSTDAASEQLLLQKNNDLSPVIISKLGPKQTLQSDDNMEHTSLGYIKKDVCHSPKGLPCLEKNEGTSQVNKYQPNEIPSMGTSLSDEKSHQDNIGHKNSKNQHQSYCSEIQGEEPRQWPCSLCTFLNYPDLPQCEMCDTPKKKMSARRRAKMRKNSMEIELTSCDSSNLPESLEKKENGGSVIKTSAELKSEKNSVGDHHKSTQGALESGEDESVIKRKINSHRIVGKFGIPTSSSKTLNKTSLNEDDFDSCLQNSPHHDLEHDNAHFGLASAQEKVDSGETKFAAHNFSVISNLETRCDSPDLFEDSPKSEDQVTVVQKSDVRFKSPSVSSFDSGESDLDDLSNYTFRNQFRTVTGGDCSSLPDKPDRTAQIPHSLSNGEFSPDQTDKADTEMLSCQSEETPILSSSSSSTCTPATFTTLRNASVNNQEFCSNTDITVSVTATSALASAGISAPPSVISSTQTDTSSETSESLTQSVPSPEPVSHSSSQSAQSAASACHKVLKFSCSVHTGRIYVYDEHEHSLQANFHPIDIEVGNVIDLPEILQVPHHQKLLQKFIREWASLTDTKKRLIAKKGLVFASPLAAYEEVKSVQGNKQRYLNKQDTLTTAVRQAKQVQGTVRVIAKHTERPVSVDSDSLSGSDGEAMRGVAQTVTAEGIPLCLHCQQPYTSSLLSAKTICQPENAWQFRLCSYECMDKYWILTKASYCRDQIYELERGVCHLCQYDSHALFTRIKSTKDLTTRAKLINKSPYSSLTSKQRQKMVEQPQAGQFWHVDHITPVWKGGGMCDLDNLRTLCTPCHLKITRRQAGQRATIKKLSSAASKGDITAFFQKS